jgi:hypothetical protein
MPPARVGTEPGGRRTLSWAYSLSNSHMPVRVNLTLIRAPGTPIRTPGTSRYSSEIHGDKHLGPSPGRTAIREPIAGQLCLSFKRFRICARSRTRRSRRRELTPDTKAPLIPKVWTSDQVESDLLRSMPHCASVWFRGNTRFGTHGHWRVTPAAFSRYHSAPVHPWEHLNWSRRDRGRSEEGCVVWS